MEGLTVTEIDGVKTIKFSKSERKNALNRVMYTKITDILNEDANNNNIVAIIFTGEGDYFTSGNDFKAVMELTNNDGDSEEFAKKANRVFKLLIKALINYPKLLIAVVNGPAIGFGATIVGLCDIVYASENATFHAPFIHLGLCCEGCSSYIFPSIMGRSKASEMLLLGKKITAQEAFEHNLVAQVIPHENLQQLFQDLQSCGKLPLKPLLINKKLIMDGMKKELHNCNNRECEALLERSTSEEFFNAVMNFMSRKSKL